MHPLQRLTRSFISQCLTLCHIDVVFGIFRLNVGDPLEFSFDGLSLDNLPDEVMLELVGHDHVHIIRWEGCDAELDRVDVVTDILGKHVGVSLVLCDLLSFIEAAVDVARGLTQSVCLRLFPFEVFHVSEVCRDLLLENLELIRVDVSLLVLFADLHILFETHQGIFDICRTSEIREHTLGILRTHLDRETLKTTLKVTERDSRPILEVHVAE